MSDDDKTGAASGIDKILERLGYGDGAWRRAFVSGLIFLAILAAYGVPPFDRLAGILPEDVAEFLKNTQVLVVAALLIFAAGFVIDGMSRGFLVRGVSVTSSLLDWLFKRFGKKVSRKSWTFPVMLATFWLWPVVILGGTVASTAQVVTLYRFGLRVNTGKQHYRLTNAGKDLFDQLPVTVQEGLDEPFGDNFDAAWQGLIVLAPAAERPWISRLASRNYDLTSFVAAGFFGLLVALCESLLRGTVTLWSFGLGYGFMCLLSYILFGCFAIIGRAAVSVVEVLAIPRPKEVLASPKRKS